MINDNTTGDIDTDNTDNDILEAWLSIHGESNESRKSILAKAKENYLGYFESSDDFVLHEIEKHGWFDGVHNLVTGNVNLESLAVQLGYCDEGYHGSDNANGHYFILQASQQPQ